MEVVESIKWVKVSCAIRYPVGAWFRYPVRAWGTWVRSRWGILGVLYIEVRIATPPRTPSTSCRRRRINEKLQCTFMMMSRSLKNDFGGRGFVKKSARFSVDCTYCTWSVCCSTSSRTKKCLRSICLVRLWYSGLYARLIVAVLSTMRGVGFGCGKPSSERNSR